MVSADIDDVIGDAPVGKVQNSEDVTFGTFSTDSTDAVFGVIAILPYEIGVVVVVMESCMREVNRVQSLYVFTE